MNLERLKTFGTILAVVTGLFTVVEVITKETVIALIVAAIGAVAASVYFARKGYLIATIMAWLVILVMILSYFVLFPHSITVDGVVYDAQGVPLGNVQVFLLDENGIERKKTTDKDGRYSFDNVPIGKIEVRTKDGHANMQTTSPFTGRTVIYIYESAATSPPSAAPAPTPLPPFSPTAIPIAEIATPTTVPTPVLPEATATNIPAATILVGYDKLPQAITNASFDGNGPGNITLSRGQLYQLIECRMRCYIRVLPGPAEVWVGPEQIGVSHAPPAPSAVVPRPTGLATPVPVPTSTPTPTLTLAPTPTPKPTSTSTPTLTPTPPIRVQINVNVEGRWMGWRTDPASNSNYAGTTDQAKRIEAIRIRLVNAPTDMQICYTVHIEDIGPTSEFCDGDMAGNPEQAKRIEAISIRLVNAPEELHIRYKAFVQDKRWMGWQCDGDLAGTTGEAKRLEAIQVKIVSSDQCP